MAVFDYFRNTSLALNVLNLAIKQIYKTRDSIETPHSQSHVKKTIQGKFLFHYIYISDNF